MNEEQNKNKSSGGIPTPAKIFIDLFSIWAGVFIVLKLLRILPLSWLWVFAPMWVPALYFVLVIFFSVIASMLLGMFRREK